MNTDTGQVYRGEAAIGAAIARGEPVVPVSERVAAAVEGGMNREQRRAQRFGRGRARSVKVSGPRRPAPSERDGKHVKGCPRCV